MSAHTLELTEDISVLNDELQTEQKDNFTKQYILFSHQSEAILTKWVIMLNWLI